MYIVHVHVYSLYIIYVNSLLSDNVYTIFHFFKTFLFLQAAAATNNSKFRLLKVVMIHDH